MALETGALEAFLPGQSLESKPPRWEEPTAPAELPARATCQRGEVILNLEPSEDSCPSHHLTATSWGP